MPGFFITVWCLLFLRFWTWPHGGSISCYCPANSWEECHRFDLLYVTCSGPSIFLPTFIYPYVFECLQEAAFLIHLALFLNQTKTWNEIRRCWHRLAVFLIHCHYRHTSSFLIKCAICSLFITFSRLVFGSAVHILCLCRPLPPPSPPPPPLSPPAPRSFTLHLSGSPSRWQQIFHRHWPLGWRCKSGLCVYGRDSAGTPCGSVFTWQAQASGLLSVARCHS